MASPLDDLELRLCELAVGHVDGREVKEAFAAAMSQGLWTDAFTDAVNADDLRREDARRLLQSAARELGLSFPDPVSARLRILRHNLLRIAEGTIDPSLGLSIIVERLPSPMLHADDLAPLMWCWWTMEDVDHDGAVLLQFPPFSGMTRGQAVSALNREMVDRARRWLEVHGA